MSNLHCYFEVISAKMTELLLSETPEDSTDEGLVRTGLKVEKELIICRGSCFFHLNKQG